MFLWPRYACKARVRRRTDSSAIGLAQPLDRRRAVLLEIGLQAVEEADHTSRESGNRRSAAVIAQAGRASRKPLKRGVDLGHERVPISRRTRFPGDLPDRAALNDRAGADRPNHRAAMRRRTPQYLTRCLQALLNSGNHVIDLIVIHL